MNEPGVIRKLSLRLLIAAALPAVYAGSACAGGFSLYEIGTADVGLAAAGYAARAQDPATVLTNPAGMTRLEGTQVLLGAQLLYGDAGLSLGSTPPAGTAGGGNGGNPIGWLPGGGAFVSHSISPSLSVGLAIGSNFGGAAKYDDDWAGRYYVRESTLLGLSLMPSIAYRVTDHLSVGATLNAMYGIMKTRVAVNNFAPGYGDGELKLDDKRWGYGVNVGLLYEVNRATRFGLTYSSQVDLDFTAHAQFNGLAPGLDAVLAARGLRDANINMGIKVPQGVMGSFFHQLDEHWAVLGNVGWQQWSKFGQVDVGVESNNPTSLTSQLNLKDTWHGALGAQYHPGGPWVYSFGMAYDSRFQQSDHASPAMPANDALRVGIGAQKQSSRDFSWGVAAEYLYGGSLSVNKQSVLPVALGGRGDLVASYGHPDAFFLSANWNWKL